MLSLIKLCKEFFEGKAEYCDKVYEKSYQFIQDPDVVKYIFEPHKLVDMYQEQGIGFIKNILYQKFDNLTSSIGRICVGSLIDESLEQMIHSIR